MFSLFRIYSEKYSCHNPPLQMPPNRSRVKKTRKTTSSINISPKNPSDSVNTSAENLSHNMINLSELNVDSSISTAITSSSDVIDLTMCSSESVQSINSTSSFVEPALEEIENTSPHIDTSYCNSKSTDLSPTPCREPTSNSKAEDLIEQSSNWNNSLTIDEELKPEIFNNDSNYINEYETESHNVLPTNTVYTTTNTSPVSNIKQRNDSKVASPNPTDCSEINDLINVSSCDSTPPYISLLSTGSIKEIISLESNDDDNDGGYVMDSQELMPPPLYTVDSTLENNQHRPSSSSISYCLPNQNIEVSMQEDSRSRSRAREADISTHKRKRRSSSRYE